MLTLIEFQSMLFISVIFLSQFSGRFIDGAPRGLEEWPYLSCTSTDLIGTGNGFLFRQKPGILDNQTVGGSVLYDNG